MPIIGTEPIPVVLVEGDARARGQEHAAPRKPVYVRCPYLGAGNTEVGESHVVDENEDDVRSLRHLVTLFSLSKLHRAVGWHKGQEVLPLVK